MATNTQDNPLSYKPTDELVRGFATYMDAIVAYPDDVAYWVLRAKEHRAELARRGYEITSTEVQNGIERAYWERRDPYRGYDMLSCAYEIRA